MKIGHKKTYITFVLQLHGGPFIPDSPLMKPEIQRVGVVIFLIQFFGSFLGVLLGVFLFLWQMLKRPRMPCSQSTDTGCLGNLWWSNLAVNDRKRRNRRRRKGRRRRNKKTQEKCFLCKLDCCEWQTETNVTVYLFFVDIKLDPLVYYYQQRLCVIYFGN